MLEVRETGQGFVSPSAELERIVVFDIETTGLNPKTNSVGMVSLCYFKGPELVVEQFMAEELSQEKLMLASAVQRIASFDLYVNFNGNSFDLPFLETRYVSILDKRRSVDLYRLSRKGNLKSRSGFERQDEMSGLEWAQGYRSFLSTKDEALRQALLLHNKDDVLSTMKLLLDEYAEIVLRRLYPNGVVESITSSEGLLRVRFLDGEVFDLDTFSYQGHRFYRHPEFDSLSIAEKEELLLETPETLHHANIRKIIERLYL